MWRNGCPRSRTGTVTWFWNLQKRDEEEEDGESMVDRLR